MRFVAAILLGVLLTVAAVFGYSRYSTAECSEAAALWRSKSEAVTDWDAVRARWQPVVENPSALGAQRDEATQHLREGYDRFTNQARAASHAVLQNPRCFSVDERAEAQTYLDAIEDARGKFGFSG